ncbi:hypothetical protein ADK66_00960 [Micromonospora sp. NRRL B-16802]|uniref:hypothetical protein n=1 Tax=Micromonospora sp. NRRL B-16802 TaxID=1415541 RepID=UPI0006AF01F2|nr:hypothetical protein [Micromonospora sp. NRRL B-16802]KOX14726.1 hypothetical protein ADK66_00960 [Micromonospora sp. NRRL B-16802]
MTTGQHGTGNVRPSVGGDAPLRPTNPPGTAKANAQSGTAETSTSAAKASTGSVKASAAEATTGATGTDGSAGDNTSTSTDDTANISAASNGATNGAAGGSTDKDAAEKATSTGSRKAGWWKAWRRKAGTADAAGKADVGTAKAGSGTDAGKAAAGTVVAGSVTDADKAKTGTTKTDTANADTANADTTKVESGTDAGDSAATRTKTKTDATEKSADEKAAGETVADVGEKDAADGKTKPVEAERWNAFASAPEPAPSRLTRAGRAVGRFVVHEWTLASLAAVALAVLMTWPTMRYPRYTLPQDYWDPSLQAWQMAWSGHILLTEPARLWQSNTFFPELWSFAFSDTLLGYAPAGMLGSGPEDAVLRYNIMFVLAHALATLGAYALARQLGAGRIGSAVAGVAYTYAPWLLAQAGHLHVLSNGGIPLALAMLARGHGWSLRYGYRPERRHDGWVYAGWLVAAWQISLGFGIGLPFAYILAGGVVVTAVLFVVRRLRTGRALPFGRRLFVADLVGGAFFAGVGLLMAYPYFKVTELHPYAERSIDDIRMYSPPVSGFVTAPAESRIWGGLHEGARGALPWHPEMTLLPGFVLYALAAGGLLFSVWRLRHRLLLLAGVLVTMAFAMGTRFFGGSFTYGLLFEHAPGWNALRTPGRLMLWTTLLLALLAAGAVTALTDRVRELAAQRIPSWPGPWLRLATLLPLLLVIAEGLNATPHQVVPTQPTAMRAAEGPLLVLPSSQNQDQHVMLWSTRGFPDVVNGGSGFTPRQLDDVRRVSQSFPDQTSVDYLRTLGVRTVVLLRSQVVGTPWEITIDAPVESLGISRQDVGDAVVYRL